MFAGDCICIMSEKQLSYQYYSEAVSTESRLLISQSSVNIQPATVDQRNLSAFGLIEYKHPFEA
jgi:hypothetical protein